MQSVTNMAPGARVLNAKVGEFKGPDGKPQPVVEMIHLAPGETKDMDLLDPEHPMIKAMMINGELLLGAPGSKPLTAEEKAAQDAAKLAASVETARKEGFEAGTKAVAANMAELQAQHEAALKEAGTHMDAFRKEGFDAGYAQAKAEATAAAATKAK